MKTDLYCVIMEIEGQFSYVHSNGGIYSNQEIFWMTKKEAEIVLKKCQNKKPERANFEIRRIVLEKP